MSMYVIPDSEEEEFAFHEYIGYKLAQYDDGAAGWMAHDVLYDIQQEYLSVFGDSE